MKTMMIMMIAATIGTATMKDDDDPGEGLPRGFSFKRLKGEKETMVFMD
jgi:hypothetical protein